MGNGEKKQMSSHMQCLVLAIGFILMALLLFPSEQYTKESAENKETVVQVSPAPAQTETIIE